MKAIWADKRLLWITGGLGSVFAILTVVGMPLKANGFFGPFSIAGALGSAALLVLLALLYAASLFGLYHLADRLTVKAASGRKESLASKITGNIFFVFVLLLACWAPVWLAFYPGTFMSDSLTQFFCYLDWMHSAHHPLLHTLLLGFCMMTGIDMHEEGHATYGIALYSVVQMVLLAAMLAYACHWLRKRGAPLWARLCATLLFALFPFYQLWSFYAQKDVLFGGLALLLVLALVDVYRDGWSSLRSPLRVIRFLVIAALMMLMRNNGVYALVLTLPFAVLLAKGARGRIALLLTACIAVYLAANNALIYALEAESASKVEMLSIPLQQIARTLRDHPNTELTDEERELLTYLYPDGHVEYYTPAIADPVKWSLDYDALDESLPDFFRLWVKLGLRHPITYAEAFLCQNLPYLVPFAEMHGHFDLGIAVNDLYPVEAISYFPTLKEVYLAYDQTLHFLNIPGTKLLSDTSFQVWLCMASIGYALWKNKKYFLPALIFLLALWGTCLLGPVALMRYMLGFFYGMPVILAAMLRE